VNPRFLKSPIQPRQRPVQAVCPLFQSTSTLFFRLFAPATLSFFLLRRRRAGPPSTLSLCRVPLFSDLDNYLSLHSFQLLFFSDFRSPSIPPLPPPPSLSLDPEAALLKSFPFLAGRLDGSPLRKTVFFSRDVDEELSGRLLFPCCTFQ